MLLFFTIVALLALLETPGERNETNREVGTGKTVSSLSDRLLDQDKRGMIGSNGFELTIVSVSAKMLNRKES